MSPNIHSSYTRRFIRKIRKYGRSKKAAQETIRICKDQDILREYLEGKRGCGYYDADIGNITIGGAVAEGVGDKNLREQHFRIKDGEHFEDCTVVTEGKTSVESKIILKCWLDDNLSDEKQFVLEENSRGIKVIHIVDHMNGGAEGQYPEGLWDAQTFQSVDLLDR